MDDAEVDDEEDQLAMKAVMKKLTDKNPAMAGKIKKRKKESETEGYDADAVVADKAATDQEKRRRPSWIKNWLSYWRA